jgi:acylphosphatase
MAQESHEIAERREVLYAGRVQGVGFRITAQGFARRCGLTGYVHNLPDGRVQLVAEGTPPALDRLQTLIAAEMSIFIRNTQSTELPATGEFTEFQIRR